MIQKFNQFVNESTNGAQNPLSIHEKINEPFTDFVERAQEEKVDFILSNEIETLRACEVCGKFINEGYIYDDITVFCSDECAIAYLGKARFDHTDEDTLYWTAWEG